MLDLTPTQHSPFFNYRACFDPQAVMRRHAVPDLLPTPGYLTNFLGVLIEPRFLPEVLQDPVTTSLWYVPETGKVEAIPIPSNWHADIAEWGAALRAVDLARDRFTMIELGCGWGCWMNNTGVAARRAGLDVHLIGIEGDAGHLSFARAALAANGFAPEQVTLHHGIAASASGFTLFPRQQQAGVDWGLQPIFLADEQQRRDAAASGQYDELPMIALADIAAPHDRIDLLHIDIQGSEADFIAGCLPVIDRKVAYLLVGTHSRRIEHLIGDTLFPAGWTLEIERLSLFDETPAGPVLVVDGVQGWRNPRLAPR